MSRERRWVEIDIDGVVAMTDRAVLVLTSEGQHWIPISQIQELVGMSVDELREWRASKPNSVTVWELIAINEGLI